MLVTDALDCTMVIMNFPQSLPYFIETCIGHDCDLKKCKNTFKDLGEVGFMCDRRTLQFQEDALQWQEPLCGLDHFLPGANWPCKGFYNFSPTSHNNLWDYK